MSKTVEQWIAYSKRNHRYFFFYEERVLDLTQFIMIHPGGKQALTNYTNKDITDILFNVFPHHPQHTLRILNRYQIGTIPPRSSPKEKPVQPISVQTPPKKVRFLKKFKDEQNDEPSNQSSDRSYEKKTSLKKPSRFNMPEPSSKKQKKSKSKSHGSSKKMKGKSFKQDQSFQQTKAQRKPLQNEGQVSSLLLQEQMDEQKPTLSIPVLAVRYMNQL